MNGVDPSGCWALWKYQL